MTTPKVLDLFCGEGGAAAGYAQAGCQVLGIDRDAGALARYPFRSVRTGWRNGLRRFATGADLIHASPPCQKYTNATNDARKRDNPDLIGPVREALIATGKPYVIENVKGAARELRDPVELCGCMFGQMVWYREPRGIYRPRLFETSWPVTGPPHTGHKWPAVSVHEQGRAKERDGFTPRNETMAKTLGVGWMSTAGLYESIPPDFTKWLAERWMESVPGPAPCAPRIDHAPGQPAGHDPVSGAHGPRHSLRVT